MMAAVRITIVVVASLITTISRAQQPPVDFSGSWTLVPPAIATTAAVPGTPAAAAAPGDMGSGWGSPLTITQDARRLTVEYVFFSRYDLQPPLTFVYPLDGSEGRNVVSMGRGEQVETSTARWDRQALIISTVHRIDDRAVGKPITMTLTRRLSLESPATLIVDVTRDGVLGGPSTTTRSTYRKN